MYGVHQAFDELLAVDNPMLVDFLSSAAAVFAEAGLLASKDVDALRVALSSTQSDRQGRERPLLEVLDEQDTEFLHLLSARYGERALAANLLRYGMRQALDALLTSLSTWGQGLLAKSKLLFNRPFYLYVQGRCERQVLSSTLLVDFAALLEEACAKLSHIRTHFNLYLGHRMASSDDAELQVDGCIATALGFSGVSTLSGAPLHDELLRQEISLVMGLVTSAVLALNEQLEQAGQGKATIAVSLGAEMLKLEGQRVAAVSYPAQANLVSYDLKRRLVLTSMQALRQGVDALAGALAQALTFSAGAVTPSPHSVAPLDVQRRMISELAYAGTPIRHAMGAVADLLAYLSVNQIAAKDLLVGELNKINPCLTPRCLHILQELGEVAPLGKVAVEEKQRTLRRSQELHERFASRLAGLAPSLLALFLLISGSGCGLKMDPASSRLDYRPDVPGNALPALPPPAPLKKAPAKP